MKKHTKSYVGELPLIHSIANRFELKELLNEFLPQQKKEEVAPADVLMMLVCNLAIGKQPLYELEGWVRSLDFKRLGYDVSSREKFNDDRFGSVLDRLFDSDRSSLMTAIVLNMVQKFKIDLSQLHNDSTSIKAYGEYPGETNEGFALKRGKSKDHRPDLKQLLFTLTVSSDGAVPVHHKIYSGNRTDDTTHIETWDVLEKIHGSPNFLYVADCKLCTEKQLDHIVDQKKGKVITIIPETWGEVSRFKNELRIEAKPKKEILRICKDHSDGEPIRYFCSYEGTHTTDKKQYSIHWIWSSIKAFVDKESREKRLVKAETKLRAILLGLNKRKLKTKEVIQKACDDILLRYEVKLFITVTIGETSELSKRQIGAGRPNINTQYEFIENKIYTLAYGRNKDLLKAEERVDGVFPLLCSDPSLSAKEVLLAYKMQPKLEKRFSQLKSIHCADPLLCKKIERIEAMMFVFFLALIVQSLLEREVRQKMKVQKLKTLRVYPEEREASHPTTAKIFDLFHSTYSYAIMKGTDIIEEYVDELNVIQQTILSLLGVTQKQYWGNNTEKTEKTPG